MLQIDTVIMAADVLSPGVNVALMALTPQYKNDNSYLILMNLWDN